MSRERARVLRRQRGRDQRGEPGEPQADLHLSSFSCAMPPPTTIQASTTSGPGCDNGLQGPPLCHLSQLSHLAKSSYTMLPKARASPSSEAILLSKEQSPNSLFRELKSSQTSLQSPLLSSDFPSPKEL